MNKSQKLSYGESRRFVGAVLDDAHFLQGDQAFLDHLVNVRKQFVDFLAGVHNFNDNGEVFREAQDLGGMQAAVGTKAHQSAQHGSAGEVELASLEYDGLIKWFAMPTVSMIDSYAKVEKVARKPRTKQPMTLTARVPVGNEPFPRRWAQPATP